MVSVTSSLIKGIIVLEKTNSNQNSEIVNNTLVLTVPSLFINWMHLLSSLHFFNMHFKFGSVNSFVSLPYFICWNSSINCIKCHTHLNGKWGSSVCILILFKMAMEGKNCVKFYVLKIRVYYSLFDIFNYIIMVYIIWVERSCRTIFDGK